MPTTPPRMRELMDDPLFRAYMKKVPSLPPSLRTGTPWQLWVFAGEGKWLTQSYPSYQEVWSAFVARFRGFPHQDPTITSRRVFYAPPGEWYKVKVRRDRPTPSGETHRIETRWRQTFSWGGVDLHWCGRCRRPVYWMPLFSDHHALRKMPAISEEDNYRCLICGVRWITTPPIEQMTKIEGKPS